MEAPPASLAPVRFLETLVCTPRINCRRQNHRQIYQNTLQDFMLFCFACDLFFFLDFTALYKNLNSQAGFNLSFGISQCGMCRHFFDASAVWRRYFVDRRRQNYPTCRPFGDGKKFTVYRSFPYF